MKLWRSYNGVAVLGWLGAVAFVAAATEASASDSELAVRLSYGVMAVAVVVVALVVYLTRRMKRRAEEKVRASGVIDLADIQVLARSGSRLLEDAIALRRAQTEEGRGSGEQD